MSIYLAGLETQVRVTVSSLQANAQSLLPGSGTDIASLQLSTADCVLNFYTSLRADAQLFTSEHPAAPHASHMDILLVAVMVEMQAARERVAVLMPANWHAAGIAVAGLLQLRLDAAFLPVHISIEGLSAGRSLLADFSQHLQAAVPIDTCKDQSSASTPQDANRQPDDIWADDLRCGLFNVLTEATQDPGKTFACAIMMLCLHGSARGMCVLPVLPRHNVCWPTLADKQYACSDCIDSPAMMTGA